MSVRFLVFSICLFCTAACMHVCYMHPMHPPPPPSPDTVVVVVFFCTNDAHSSTRKDEGILAKKPAWQEITNQSLTLQNLPSSELRKKEENLNIMWVVGNGFS